MPSPHRGHAPVREWSVCSSAQRRRAVSRLIPSAPRAHGAWGGTRATAGATTSPTASAIAARRARHPVLRASIRASAGTTPNPKSAMCAGTGTPDEPDEGGTEAPSESPTKHGPLSQRSPSLPRRREAGGSDGQLGTWRSGGRSDRTRWRARLGRIRPRSLSYAQSGTASEKTLAGRCGAPDRPSGRGRWSGGAGRPRTAGREGAPTPIMVTPGPRKNHEAAHWPFPGSAIISRMSAAAPKSRSCGPCTGQPALAPPPPRIRRVGE